MVIMCLEIIFCVSGMFLFMCSVDCALVCLETHTGTTSKSTRCIIYISRVLSASSLLFFIHGYRLMVANGFVHRWTRNYWEPPKCQWAHQVPRSTPSTVGQAVTVTVKVFQVLKFKCHCVNWVTSRYYSVIDDVGKHHAVNFIFISFSL